MRGLGMIVRRRGRRRRVRSFRSGGWLLDESQVVTYLWLFELCEFWCTGNDFSWVLMTIERRFHDLEPHSSTKYL